MEWYGLTVGEAIKKLRQEQVAAGPPPPLKHQYRAELIEKLKTLRDNPTPVRYLKYSTPSESIAQLGRFLNQQTCHVALSLGTCCELELASYYIMYCYAVFRQVKYWLHDISLFCFNALPVYI